MSAITSNRKICDYAIMSQHGLHSAKASQGGTRSLNDAAVWFFFCFFFKCVLLVMALPEL